MHFQLTKYKILLGKGMLAPLQPSPGGQPRGPHIVNRCLDALRGFDEYQFYHVHMGLHEIEKKNESHNASILPSFQSYNALICNILIFGIIFDYDFCQFLINIWRESGTKRSQNRPIWLYSNV